MVYELYEDPEAARLRAAVKDLRKRLYEAVTERDELRLVVCRNLETAYLLAFGAAEYRLHELYCRSLRLKRACELIRAKLNRRERPDVSAVEAQLDAEFAAYTQKLESQVHAMNAALERNKGKVLSEKESKALKTMYHRIVKALHPDLHPELSPEKQKLFLQATEAYKRADTSVLGVIDGMIGDDGESTAEEDGPDSAEVSVALKAKVAQLESSLETIAQEIASIKASYPYCEREKLFDEEKKAAYQAELKARLQEAEASVRAYEQALKEMMNE